MRVRLTLALLMLVLLAGCGGNNDRRDAVAAYFTQVNAVESQMARPLLEVSKANQAFARGKADPAKTRARLAKSDRTFVRLRRKLAALDVPPDGRRLQSLLLQLVDRQRALGRETLQLARFLPAFGVALRPVAPAGRELRRALNGTGPAVAKAAALELYGRRLDAVLVRLGRLDPPPASRPTWSVQIRTLASVRASVLALAQALRKKESQQIAPLLHRFDVAAIMSRSTSAQQAQIEAVQAYNKRIRALDKLLRRIALERARLQKLLR